MDLYRENLMDHYKNPRNYGRPTDWKTKYIWEEVNPSCGDRVGVALKVVRRRSDKGATSTITGGVEEDGEVEEARFWGEGCVVSMAAASMLTEYIKRKSLKEVKRMAGEEVLELLGGEQMIPAARLRCALLGLEAMKRAIGCRNSA